MTMRKAVWRKWLTMALVCCMLASFAGMAVAAPDEGHSDSATATSGKRRDIRHSGPPSEPPGRAPGEPPGRPPGKPGGPPWTSPSPEDSTGVVTGTVYAPDLTPLSGALVTVAASEFVAVSTRSSYIPPDNVQIKWQRCFSEEGTVQAAIDAIIDFFERNPDSVSFSLGVNDSGGYCEEEPDHPNYPGRYNSIGLVDMSDIYYDWVNKVVEGVMEVYPDKWFGLLAYQNVMDPPSFKLHDRVVPYITKDRMSWVDEEIREAGEDQMDEWRKVANHVAWYDYLYGTPYLLPRIYNNEMAEIYQYSRANGVIAHVAELYPNWGEGPKPWLSAKLQWNPDQDVNILLEEWYERAVGPEAAPYLAAYYDHWEHFWTERVPATAWFQSRKNTTYLPFNMGNYLDIVTEEEIAESRRLLETVLVKAQTEPQRNRARKMLQAFEYYEVSALSYPRKVAAPANAEEALALLEKVEKNLQTALQFAGKRFELVEDYKTDSILMHPLVPTRWNDLIWSGWNAYLFWQLVDYVKQNEPINGPVRQRINVLGSDSKDMQVRQYANLLLSAADGNPMNANPSFEGGSDSAVSWKSSIINYGEFRRVEDGFSYTGNASIYVHNFYYGKLSQTLDIQPGLKVQRIRYYVSPDTKSVGTIYLTFNYLDEQGNLLGSVNSPQESFTGSLGKWSDIALLTDVPEKVQDVEVKKVEMIVTINGFQEGGTLYLDDFELY